MTNFVGAALLILLSVTSAWGGDFKSYEPIKGDKDVNTLKLIAGAEGPKSPEKMQSLIHEQMDKNWKKPTPTYEIKAPGFNIRQFSEGTGTRGGGSGLLVQRADSTTEVKLIEIFRSENLARYNQFFPVDPELLALENAGSTDEAAKKIFETVMARIQQVAPRLARKINEVYVGDLSLDKWIPIFDDLPLVDDEVAHPLEDNKNKIQIASRRTGFIMYNTRAYAAMSPLNRAALWMHEYLYVLSGNEISLKTQRAVSLFFSSEFLTLAQDDVKIAQFFFEVGLLSISRSSLQSSLPEGAKVSSVKQSNKCFRMLGMKGDPQSRVLEVFIDVEGVRNIFKLKPDELVAKLFASAIAFGKIHLSTDFPLYKYPGQKIMPDKICFNTWSTKITQVQVAVAIDEEVSAAVKAEALAEVRLAQKQSEYSLLRKTDPTSYEAQVRILNELSDLSLELYKRQTQTSILELTPLEKMMNPKILGEYNIEFNY